MRLDDRSADREADADPLCLCCIKTVENAIEILWVETAAGIFDADDYGLVLAEPRANGHDPRPAHGLAHRLRGIGNEIDEHLLQLHRIAHDRRQGICQIGAYRDPLAVERRPQQIDDIIDDAVDLEDNMARPFLAEQRANAAGHLSGAGRVTDDAVRRFARIRQRRWT